LCNAAENDIGEEILGMTGANRFPYVVLFVHQNENEKKGNQKIENENQQKENVEEKKWVNMHSYLRRAGRSEQKI